MRDDEELSEPDEDENDTPLTNHQLLQLGRISYYAASIESQMLAVAVQLVGRDVLAEEETTRVLLRGASMQELQERIAALLNRVEVSESDKAYIRARITQASSAIGKRNHLMHGAWVDHEGGQVIIQQRRNKSNRALTFHDEEAAAIADELADAYLTDVLWMDDPWSVFPVALSAAVAGAARVTVSPAASRNAVATAVRVFIDLPVPSSPAKRGARRMLRRYC